MKGIGVKLFRASGAGIDAPRSIAKQVAEFSLHMMSGLWAVKGVKQSAPWVVSQFDRKIFSSVILSESVGANATKDESKDPEDASFALPHQGILPKQIESLLIPGEQK